MTLPHAPAPRRKQDIESIHYLTPMQQGLLFHAQPSGDGTAGGSDPYFRQDCFRIDGELDVAAFEAAWTEVAARHPMLRTDFRWENVPQPMQLVFRPRPVQFRRLDWRHAPDAEARLAAELQAGHERGFDLKHAGDPALTLVQLAEARWIFIWAYHHIAVDGWSFALVLRDVLACYHARLRGQPAALPPAPPFRDYLGWRERQDEAAALAFWQQELADFDGPTPLPLARTASDPASTSRWAELALPLGEGDALNAFLKQQRITLSTLCQGLWALFLSRATGQPRVTFGVTVSGRPEDLPGADDIVGLFINTVPLSVAFGTNAGQPVGDWLRGLQDHNTRLRQHDWLPLARIQSEIQRNTASRSLFDTLLVVENFPVDATLTEAGSGLRIALQAPEAVDGVPRDTGGRNNYPLTLVVVPGATPRPGDCRTRGREGENALKRGQFREDLRHVAGLHNESPNENGPFSAHLQPAHRKSDSLLVLAYDRRQVDDAGVQWLGRRLQTLLANLLASARRPLGEIALTEAAEMAGAPTGEAAPYTALPELIARWAQQTPDAPAVTGADGSLSYGELDAAAEALANRLRVGIPTINTEGDALVAVLAERSAAFVVALLACWKAGAAFLPLDPAQPAERLAELVETAGVAAVLAQEPAAALRIAGNRPVLAIREQHSNVAARPNPARRWLPGQAAYVIYTSGSTGKPKGVVVSHGALAQYTSGVLARLQPPPGAPFAMVSTVAADLGHTVLFGALAAGCPLHLLPATLAFDPDGFADTLRRQAIAVLKIVPGHLAGLLSAAQPALPSSTLVLGGEATPPALLQRIAELAPAVRVFNHYGPTETTVGVLAGELRHGNAAVALGRPLPGVVVRVLDAALQPVPAGMPGELYIGGGQVARGYLGRPDLTAERFIPDPQGSGQRLYRSGDRVVSQPDGSLLFLGRADDQVKIRGYRVEPAEVAAAIRQLPGVSDAAVIARDGRLLGYATPATLDPAALLAELARRLPEALVPAALVPLAALPRTPNGKVDRRALPDPATAAPVPATDSAPRNPVEAALAEIWAAVLNKPEVGIHDNFFELGGDSILNLQIIGRARQRGIRLTPKQMFEQQTIARLAATAVLAPPKAARPATPPAAPADQPLPLTAIQQWFFAADLPERHHWNQSVLLETGRPLASSALEAALQWLVQRHDALRLRFAPAGDGWRQTVAARETAPLSRVVDLSGCSPEGIEAAITTECAAAQRSLDLTRGPLLRAVYFDLGTERPGRLFAAAHHLVIDSVSWRILAEELQAAYPVIAAGQTPSLPAPATTFAAWTGTAVRAAAPLTPEAAWWTAAAAAPTPSLPLTTTAPGANTYGNAAHYRLQLSAAATAQLLGPAPAAYRCRSEDLLLTALAGALCRWTGGEAVWLELEGHGRQPPFADVDLSQTIGWFTTRYPVRLAPVTADDPAAALKAVKEQLRQVPNQGYGFGLLRYLHPDAAVREALAAVPVPQVNFNYLGRVDAGADRGWLKPLETAGDTRGPANPRSHLLDVDAQVADGCLTIEWTYPPALLAADQVESMAGDCLRRLEALVAHCCSRAHPGATPSDFPLAALAGTTLDRLLERYPATADLYPLSPLQTGLWYHSRSQRAGVGPAAYVNQLHCRVGPGLDLARFRQAWNDAVARHDILRTAFVADGLENPLQLVLAQVDLPWQELDWRGRDAAAALPAWLAADQAAGFDLATAPLMRITLIRVDDGWHLVWTRHHLLLDGWGTGALLNEVLARYAGRFAAEPAPPYRGYIAWLQQRNAAADEHFWRSTLGDLESPTLLQAQVAAPSPPTAGYHRQRHTLAQAAGTALQQLARTQRVTLNTLVQAAWALLLARYCRRDDVVFGVTVAGRPDDLPGAEQMLGLFINTVPLRCTVPAATPLADWWQDIQSRNLARREHEHAQLAEVQGWAGLPGGTPLFDTLLVFENYPVRRDTFAAFGAELGLELIDAAENGSFPLMLVVYPGEPLSFELRYRGECFDAATVAGFAEQFATLLTAFADDARPADAARRRVAEIPLQQAKPRLAAPAEEARVGSAKPLPTLVRHFEHHAAATPTAIALTLGDEHLSYGELNRRANRLAHQLRAAGVSAETPVALRCERSFELVVAVLAVLKAGGYYVPIDPALPAERATAIVADCGATLLLNGGAAPLPATPGVNQIEVAAALNATASEADLPPVAGPDHLAYVIYTSGSTGQPKGVPVSHANLARLFESTAANADGSYGFSFGANDVWTLFHSYAFDFSVWELWGALAYGGRLVIVPLAVARDPAATVELVLAQQVTVLNQTPSAFYRFAETAAAAADGAPDTLSGPRAWPLRYVIFGGEALDPGRLADWFRHFGDARPQLINMYGITETTVHVTWRRVVAGDGARSLIGRPLTDLQLYVLDETLAPAPVGMAGELYVGGAGLARGYLNRPQLTAERFIPDPFSGRPGDRLYRSGDLARRTADGDIEYLGRIDQQVKIRGFRIELGEIEACLRRHPAVRDVSVLAMAEADREARLVAFVATHDATLDHDVLRTLAKSWLPEYMVPAACVLLAELPLTPNGKLDRKALAAFAPGRGERTLTPPRNALETTLAGLWAEVLRVESVGIHDDFFELGGHSLLATRLVAKMTAATGLKVELADLFARPTIAELAALATPAPSPETTQDAAAELDFMAGLLDELEQESR